MKKIIYLVISVMFILGMQVRVNADTCSNEEIERLRGLVEKIEFSYDYNWVVYHYDEENDERYWRPIFTITVKNISDELKIDINSDSELYYGVYDEFQSNEDGIININGFRDSADVDIIIRAYIGNDCKDNIVSTEHIKLPTLNSKFYSETCKDYPNFKYCAKFVDKRITDEEFNIEFEKWKNGELNNDDNSNILNSSNNNNYLIVFLICLIVVVAFIISLVVIYRNRQSDNV